MLERLRLALLGTCLVGIPTFSVACTSTANVDDAYMALDAQGDRRRDVFFTDTEAIFCVAEFAASRTDVTLNMKLHQLSRYDFVQNQIVPFDAYPTEVEIAPGATTRSLQTLQLIKVATDGTQADGLPYTAGDYQCEILLDGHLEKTLKFSIQFPPCPDTQISPNSTCLGFYRMGDKCPELGAASTQQLFCTCQTPCTTDTTDLPDDISSYAAVGGACPVVEALDSQNMNMSFMPKHYSGETALGGMGNLTGGDWKCDPIQ